MYTASTPIAASILAAALTGCAAQAALTPGARPHDMSVTGHQAAADNEEHLAQVEEAKYNPAAARTTTSCRSDPFGQDDICWDTIVNPTDEHKKLAEEHRKRAQDHRAASRALVDAEARACQGVSEDDRDMSPFAHKEDIESVRILPGIGVGVVFRDVPGLTVDRLRGIVECHAARNASLGFVTGSEYCPLALKGIRTTVLKTDAGIELTVESDDPAVVAKIVERGQRLQTRRSSEARSSL